MDVLAPELMWIDGRCYRMPILDSAVSSDDIDKYKNCELEDPESMAMYEEEHEEIVEMPEIQVMQNGRHKILFPVARCFLPFIIGSKGATIRRISKDTGCTIYTPKLMGNSNVEIIGANKKQVTLAWKSICFVMKSSRNKLQPTHFVSIPLISNEVRENMMKFQESVLSECGSDRGVVKEIFQIPEKLHLTICVLTLLDDKERKLAEEKLAEVGNNIIRPMLDGRLPLIVEVIGVDTMNDDPTEAGVVFANARVPDSSDLLQDLSDKIAEAFSDLEMTKREANQRVKLHVTVMNTSMLLKSEDCDGDESGYAKAGVRNREKVTFNATNVLRKFKDFNFGKQEVKAIHLSTRFTKDDNGYYKSVGVFEL